MNRAATALTSEQLLWMLQLASPGLPVGAYAYSEGLEALVAGGEIADRKTLQAWIEGQLQSGTIRIETALMLRGRSSWQDLSALSAWNAWLSASWETSELRAQSWQMGRSLGRLLGELAPEARDIFASSVPSADSDWNWAIAWGVGMALRDIPPTAAALAFLQAWATNLIGVGVKLIPLGQTAGQQLALELHTCIQTVAVEIAGWDASDTTQLTCCSWGLALASLAHQTQHVRLFRS